MVFGACPVLSFTSPPSSRWVEPREPLQGAAYAVQKAAVFPPRKKKKKKKGCFNPCCKQSSDSLCWLSRIASDFFSNAAAAGTEPEELKCGRWIISYPSSIYPTQELLFVPLFAEFQGVLRLVFFCCGFRNSFLKQEANISQQRMPRPIT
nr:uncharacterized protein LOC129532669 [Gorilla gorilla gorilla]